MNSRARRLDPGDAAAAMAALARGLLRLRSAAVISAAAAISVLLPCGALAQPAAAPACELPRASGTTTHAVDVGGREREYMLVVPEGYDGRRPVPLVLTFHGSGSNPEQQLALSELPAAAGARGFVVVAPYAATPREAGGFTWNVPPAPGRPDDVAFTRAVIEDVGAKVCLDAGRIYASGFSGGARLSSTLACELDGRIAAIGAVGGLRHPADCDPGRAVPIIAFHGTADPVNPYEGGGPEYWGHGVEAAFEAWGAEHGGRGPSETAVAPSVARLAYAAADSRDAVVLYRLDGMGHVWPGSGYAFPSDVLGPASDAIDATQLMLDFFADRALR